jgi:hypothetical protein
MTPASMSATSGDFRLGDSRFFGVGQLEALLCVSKGSVLSQPLLGGEFTEEASQPGVEVSMLVPWHSGDSVLDSGCLSGFMDGILFL